MRRALLLTAAFAAAVAVFTLYFLPPARQRVAAPWADGSVPGLLHIHTNRSDGRSGPDDIAIAAARAGLKFVVFTDHGDGTRTPDPPVYRSGVLCLDGVEISTTGGHYVVIDMGPAPYPLGGEARDVVDDVRRLGGFGVAAHPDSPKADLSWSDWTSPVDAVEIVNPDTSWRLRALEKGTRARLRLLSAVLDYPIRATETIGALLTRSSALAAQWDALAAQRHVVALAGVDAHAKLELGSIDPSGDRFAIPIPGYETSFRTLSVHVVPDEPFTGNAAADARSLIRGIRQGRAYVAVDAWATPPAFDFTATNSSGTASAGETLTPGGDVSLHVRSNAPPGFLTTIWQGGSPLAPESPENDFTLPVGGAPAVYRVEIRSQDRPSGPAWITSNPIYVRRGDAVAMPAPSRIATKRLPLFDGHSSAGWTTESDKTSLAAVEVITMIAGPEVRLRYGLAGGSIVGQFSGAAVETTHGVADYDRVRFTIRGEHPMRVSVQIRAETAGESPERWQRSIYVDDTYREHTVLFSDMRPIGATHTSQPNLERARAIMFIVDTTNTKPGASGRIWMRDINLER